MNKSFDVLIIGGGVIGSAVAYFLAANPDFDGSILLAERDPTYRTASTSLSAAGIRTQFSSPINVAIGQFGVSFLRSFADTMAVDDDRPDLSFHEAGYLFLAGTQEQANTLRKNNKVQTAYGADVVLMEPDDLVRAFPHLCAMDLLLASYGRSGEGWFSNTGLMNGLRKKAVSLGVVTVSEAVTAICREGNAIGAVMLTSGRTIAVGTVVNATGPRAGLTARLAGLALPVEPRKRTVFVFDCARSPEGSASVCGGRLPLMIDPSGVWCRPEGSLFLCGCPPVDDPAVDFDDFEPRYHEFDDIIWPALANRSRAFEAIRVVNQWAGHYDFNTLDHNLIVGQHPEVTNFVFANGFSGHGLQQAPATGRAVAELITYGSYRTIDFSAVGYERVAANRPFMETAVI